MLNLVPIRKGIEAVLGTCAFYDFENNKLIKVAMMSVSKRTYLGTYLHI